MTTNEATLSRLEAKHLDIDELPGDFGPAYPEPECWGENSYEHYKGDCRHFGHEEETGCDFCGYEDCRCDDEPDDSLDEWLADLKADR